jgi:hypothetical protein
LIVKITGIFNVKWPEDTVELEPDTAMAASARVPLYLRFGRLELSNKASAAKEGHPQLLNTTYSAGGRY